uniref:Zinc finger protein n=1 Tax=Rhizophora mucronata TaxID=61149 RepID=A0A2P2IH34_RHIMU
MWRQLGSCLISSLPSNSYKQTAQLSVVGSARSEKLTTGRNSRMRTAKTEWNSENRW